MAIKINEIYRAVNSLAKNIQYTFANASNKNTFSLIHADKTKGVLFHRFNSDETQKVVVTTRNLQKLSEKIRPYVPFSIDVVVGASGNWRSLFESALALTPNFFMCYINSQRRLIYAPDHSHDVGVYEILTPQKFLEFSKQSHFYDYKFFIDNCYPLEGCLQSFLNAFVRMPRIIRNVEPDFTSLFDYDDPLYISIILEKLNSEYPTDMSMHISGFNVSFSEVLKSYILFLNAKNNYSFY